MTDQDLKDHIHTMLLRRTIQDIYTGCWEWQGATQPRTGCGVARVRGRQFTAHRLAYWVYVRGFELAGRARVQHLCGNPRCVNPDHLRKVTRRRSGKSRMIALA